MSSYIMLREIGDTGKTKRYSVENSGAGGSRAFLGEIKWYAPWRRYCFSPAGNTVYDASCLQDLTNELHRLTETHRTAKRGPG